mmetsp:Transcript_5211/g.8588  ORF Transcript_5211/g.8588 Transcript_5211/m.8588 type:complete len:466 (-) Transcript_5211:51-1448(-)
MISTKLAILITATAAWRQVEAFSSISSTSSSTTRGLLLPIRTRAQSSLSSFRLYQQRISNNDDNEVIMNDNQSSSPSPSSSTACWNPNLRKTIAAISSLGILETAYLTYDKLQYTSSGGKTSGGASLITALCSSNQGSVGGGGVGSVSSCNDVLHGPYASLHIGTLDIPLSVLGMMAYTMVFSLAIFPVLFNETNEQTSSSSSSSSSSNNNGGEKAVVLVPDGQNRIALLGITTLMASFSVYLVSLIIGVLHASCLFCFLSAGFSLSLAGLSWFGVMLPGSSSGEEVDEGMDRNVLLDISELRKSGMTVGASSVGLATVMALGIFLTVDDTTASTMPSAASSGTLLASTSKTAARFEENVPPAITTTSSKAALALAADLKSLDARMFGAFWCSHCYDQKQALGYEAMQTIPYIECDREGFNSKRDFCKEKDVPGYPTWEIGGKLFPGERSVEELREMVDEVMSSK